MSTTLPGSLIDPKPRRDSFRLGSNYYLAALSETMRWPLRRYAQAASRGAPSPPTAWGKGLLLGPSHIGDVLYNTPSLPALKAGLPNCEWVYAASGASAEVLEGNPHLREVIRIPPLGTDLARTCELLAPHRFEAMIAYTSGPALKEMRIALRLGIPNRVGYVHKGFSGLVTHPVSIQFPQAFPAYFRDLVTQLTGNSVGAIPSLKPLVYPMPDHHQKAADFARQAGIDWDKQPVLACAVTSRQPSGIWPEDQFLEAIRLLRERVNCTIVYTGAKDDAPQLERLARQSGADAFVLAGELDLLSFVAFLSRCRAALAPDSGTRHLANAAGIPVVFPRNISFRQKEAGSYCDTDHDVAPEYLEMVAPADQAAAFKAIEPAKAAAELIRAMS